jgi:DNA uptake protein ComE-like DNA-binding protein
LEKLRDKIWFGPGIEEVAVKKVPRKTEEPAKEYTGEKININTASAEEIHTKTGLNKTVCFSITGCRKRDGNYRSVEDLANVPRFTEAHMKKYGPMFEV